MPKSSLIKLALTALTIFALLAGVAGGTIRTKTYRESISKVRSAAIVNEMAATVSIRAKARKGGNSMVRGKWVLTARPGRESFKLGEPATLRLSLSNYSKKEIYVIDTNPSRDNEIEIKNPKGEKMPMSQKGKRLMDSPVLRRTVSKIDAGQTIQYTIAISDLYDLTSRGTYTVTVKRKILMEDKKTFVEVLSYPVKVIVHL